MRLLVLVVSLLFTSAAAQPDSTAVREAERLTAEATVLYRADRPAEAVAPAREALRLLEEAFGPGHPETATAHANLGTLLGGAGALAEAADHLGQAAALREAALAAGHPDVDAASVAASFRRAGDAEALRGAFGEAERHFRRALGVIEAHLGPEDPALLGALSGLGEALRHGGRLDDALAVLTRAVDVAEAAYGAEHEEVAITLGNLSIAQAEAGDLAAAAEALERGIAIEEAVGLTETPGHGATLGNLAYVRVRQGAYAEARALLERAIALETAAYGPDDPELVPHYSNLGDVLRLTGDYPAARAAYERAIAILEGAYGPDYPDLGIVLSNLATLLSAQGDAAEALRLHERVRDLTVRAFGPDHPRMGTVYGNLAIALTTAGRGDEAGEAYRRALAITEATYGPGHPATGVALNNLASHLQDRGARADALSLFERALAIARAEYGDAHPQTASSASNLALLLAELGRYNDAYDRYLETLRIRGAVLGDDHLDVAHTHNDLGLLLMHGDAANRATARAHLLAASRGYDRFAERVLPAFSFAEQRAFVDLDLDGQVGILLSAFPEGKGLAGAYDLVGGWKGLLLRELRRQTAMAALADDPAYAEAVARLRRVRAELARAFRDRSPELQALTEEKESLERALAAATPEASADPWRAHGIGGLRAALPAGSAFVDLYRHTRWEGGEPVGTRYGAVVTVAGAASVLVDLGAADAIDRALAGWRGAVTSGAQADTDALASRVWDPIADVLPAGVARAWVSPDGALARAPWAALAAAHDPAGRLLVAQVPSGRALLALLDTEPDAPADPSLLLVGGVDFGAGGGFAPLPGTAREVDALAALAGERGLDATVLTGDAPTAPVVADALRGATYAHLATHGFFFGETAAAVAARGTAAAVSRRAFGTDEESAPTGVARAAIARNPLVESGLALAGANDPGAAPGGGTLTAEELVGLDLRGTRLVVLSACETGRGAEVTGQGVLGLQASVTAAGARALLMSLWAVPDASTAALMEAFYRGLWAEGLAPAEALRAAQAEVRATPGWEAPVHWAAWVLSGDGL